MGLGWIGNLGFCGLWRTLLSANYRPSRSSTADQFLQTRFSGDSRRPRHGVLRTAARYCPDGDGDGDGDSDRRVSATGRDGKSAVAQTVITGLLIAGKIVLTLLVLCLVVGLFFALGVVGHSSPVYNRYGHYDPYSPWAPYTANGAIDQPGYKGRALDSGV
ncbi:hypothetical protein FJT64_022168 [Amphibalanus amphitrite]|uniref:Uncharacterized protein n=1 Tax=Amphibalanus amphitrite TaxID=1232801 RepID=A0A6A4WM14_AMPAM|nr:hypothetical protein FJT64_022168 [Amphibalanus amphitrite]